MSTPGLQVNTYNIIRNWYDWCFENPDFAKPPHAAIYFYAIDSNNRFGWKDKFGFPALQAMEATGIKSKNTYYKAFNELVEWNFITIVTKSKNQNTANIISIPAVLESKSAKVSANNKAEVTALDLANIQQEDSGGNIDKQVNHKKNKPLKQETPPNPQGGNKKPQQEKFTNSDFENELKNLGVESQHLKDWLKVRKSKKASNTKTALEKFLNECSKNKFSVPEAVKICAEHSWSGFEVEWLKNLKQNFNSNQNGNSNAKSEPTVNRQTAEVIYQNSQGWEIE